MRKSRYTEEHIISFIKQAETGLRTKSWDEFATADAPTIDYMINLCDEAAGETIPEWPGHPISAHRGIPDPVAAGPSEETKRRTINQAAAGLHKRIELLMALPTRTLDRMSLQAHLDKIGGAA